MGQRYKPFFSSLIRKLAHDRGGWRKKKEAYPTVRYIRLDDDDNDGNSRNSHLR